MAPSEFRRHWCEIWSLGNLSYNESGPSKTDGEPKQVFMVNQAKYYVVESHCISDMMNSGKKLIPATTQTTDSSNELIHRTKVFYDKDEKNNL